MRFFFLLAFFLAFTLPAAAVLDEGSLPVFAITDAGTALTANLTLHIQPGSGKVYTTVKPLVGTSTQTTELIAVDVARRFSDHVDKFDYSFDITSDASLVEGPSAGAAMALLAISLLQDKKIPAFVALTGTITEEGFVGNVGGVFEKAREAARVGIKLFLVPPGETQQVIRENNSVQSVNLSNYALKNWGMKVVEVSSIDDVLQYAFQDPDTIDVNAQGGTVPDFVPPGITTSPDLDNMRMLTRKLVEESNQTVKDARNSLATSLLNKPRTVNTLLNILNSAESNIKQANILLDQNYLFSAANFAFLAKVDAGTVIDASEKTGVLEQNSPAFEVKLFNQKKRAQELQADLNQFMPVDYLEWQIAAQQRVSWARLKLDTLESTVPIVVEGSPEETLLQRLHELHFAIAWLDVADDFSAIAQLPGKKVLQGDAFKTDFERALQQAEQGISEFENGDSEQAMEKIDAAKLKGNWGWYEAAAFDAIFSYSLSQGAAFSRGKSLGELRESLATGITGLDAEIRDKNAPLIWSRLYLDHARYFSRAITHYEQHNQSASALEAARNGMTLLFLAKNLSELTPKFSQHYAAVPDSQQYAGKISQKPLIIFPENLAPYFLLIIGLIAGFFLLALGILAFQTRSSRQQLLSGKLASLREQRKIADVQFQHKKISEHEYLRRTKAIDERLHALVYRQEQMSAETVQVDKLESRIDSDKKVLKKVQLQHDKGLVLETDFYAVREKLEHQITKLKSELRRHKRLIAEFSAPKKAGKKFAWKKQTSEIKNDKARAAPKK